MLRLLNWHFWGVVKDWLQIIPFLNFLRLVLRNNRIHFPRGYNFFEIYCLRVFDGASYRNLFILIHQLLFFFLEQSMKLPKLYHLDVDCLKLNVIKNFNVEVYFGPWLSSLQIFSIFLLSQFPALLILLRHLIFFLLFGFLRIRSGFIPSRLPENLSALLPKAVLLVRSFGVGWLILAFHTRFWYFALLDAHLTYRIQYLRTFLRNFWRATSLCPLRLRWKVTHPISWLLDETSRSTPSRCFTSPWWFSVHWFGIAKLTPQIIWLVKFKLTKDETEFCSSARFRSVQI